MKKWLCMILALVLMLGVVGSAPAEENKTVDIPDLGLTIPLEPLDEIQDQIKGYLYFGSGTVMTLNDENPYIALATIYYWPDEKEDVERYFSMTEDNYDGALAARVSSLACTLVNVVVSDDDHLEQTLNQGLGQKDPLGKLTEFNTCGSYRFYYGVNPDQSNEIFKNYNELTGEMTKDLPAEKIDEWKAEFESTQSGVIEVLKSAEVREPVPLSKSLVGQKFSFETLDLDGNPVTSEELFAQNEITMVNAWGTWCGYCLNEMEFLGNMYRELKDEGFGILGLEYEYGEWTEDLIAQSRNIQKQYNVTWPSVRYPENHEMLESVVVGFPTSIFVDKDGVILAPIISGARTDKYRETYEAIKAGRAVSAEQPAAEDGEEKQPAQLDGASVYHVYVRDGEKPVAGALIQFCDDTACHVGITDENGLAAFDEQEGVYEVHVLSVPEGYELPDTVQKTENGFEDIVFQLKAK